MDTYISKTVIEYQVTKIQIFNKSTHLLAVTISKNIGFLTIQCYSTHAV